MRGGADPALRAPPRETDKVYAWFAIGVAKVYTGTEMFTSEATKQQKKFTLLQNRFAFQPKKFGVSLHFGKKKFSFRPKKSLHFGQKVYNNYQKNAEKFT